jgi:thioredoxin reductase
MHDIIVIGAGPAGMTAALYALRADKSVLLLEKENFYSLYREEIIKNGNYIFLYSKSSNI